MFRPACWLIPTILMAWAPAVRSQPEEPVYRFPEGVQVDRDLNYGGKGNPRQTLDLIRPEKPRDGKPTPVVVLIHPGAFRAGDKSMSHHEAADLVSTGDLAVAAINYRLSGDAIWPAQIHDAKAAVRWVRANAAKYGLDPNRIAAMGSDSGGHLAAMLGLTGDVPALEGDVGPHTGVSSRVACVIDRFGPSNFLSLADFPGRIDHNAADSSESLLIGGPLPQNKEKAKAASPVSYVSHEDPPFLILHGDEDPLIPYQQSEELAEALRKEGVFCVLVNVVGGGHGVFRRPEVGHRIRQFLDKHLLGRPVDEVSGLAIPRPGEPGKARSREKAKTKTKTKVKANANVAPRSRL